MTRQPLYERIARELRGRITSGKVAVGDALPTEAALCEKFRVSRHTAREALRSLRDAGLITRRPRSGTTVAAASAHAAFTLPVSSAADLFRYASDTRFIIERRSRIRAGRAESALLRCRRGQAWLKLSGIRRQAGEGPPICLTTVYLHACLSALAARLPRSPGVIYPRVEEALGVRIAWVGQRIEAEMLGEDAARRLGSTPGGAALRVRRYYYDGNDRLLEVSDSLHPARRFAYEMRLRRDEREAASTPP